MCFDGIEGKKLANEVVREKRERKKKTKESFALECFGGSGREKRGKKEKRREKRRVRVWRRKKEGEKKKKRRKYGWKKESKEIREK